MYWQLRGNILVTVFLNQRQIIHMRFDTASRKELMPDVMKSDMELTRERITPKRSHLNLDEQCCNKQCWTKNTKTWITQVCNLNGTKIRNDVGVMLMGKLQSSEYSQPTVSLFYVKIRLERRVKSITCVRSFKSDLRGYAYTKQCGHKTKTNKQTTVITVLP